LAFLQECGRQGVSVSGADLDQVWLVIKDALQHPSLNWTMTRSAQGLLAIPLWSIVVDGRIEELFRAHIWLPDGVRADPSLAIHLHQPFAQSWILAGEGTDYVFDVTPSDEKGATHAEYLVGWKGKDDKESNKAYNIHNKSSTATNTGRLVRVVPAQTRTHTRNMSYCVPAGAFHRSEVEPDVLHATIFFFDSSRGYVPDAAVIGPISRAPFTHERIPPAISTPDAADLISDLRNWEMLHEEGQQFSDEGQWEEAIRAYRTALHICNRQSWLNLPRYTHYTLGRIGHMYRMLGLNDQACASLEEAVIDTPLTKYRVYCLGELATVYRHMTRLEDCRKASEDQYNTAKILNLDKFACRAIGILGMVNYQLFQLNEDRHLLTTAIRQLEERIDRAQQIEDVVLEAIGHGRISLCYIAQGSYQKAIDAAQRNFDLMQLQGDATKRGFASAFLGRTLLLVGRKVEALALFNTSYGCPPIVALCREISDEHRQYIVEMIEAGADLTLQDEHGYTALECAIYHGDEPTAKIVEAALHVQLAREGSDVEQQIQRFRYEATLRKGYRDVFQDRLRPVLLAAKDDSSSHLNDLRKAYATCLSADPMKQVTFDRLKYVTYSDFLSSNRLPRSNNGYTQDCTENSEVIKDPFILFFSYRWIAKDPGAQAIGDSPDDIHHMQYQRMLRAIKLFLERHPTIDRKQMCIWLVSNSSFPKFDHLTHDPH
jgi:tetratricopeptide (TPR) repeat protein